METEGLDLKWDLSLDNNGNPDDIALFEDKEGNMPNGEEDKEKIVESSNEEKDDEVAIKKEQQEDSDKQKENSINVSKSRLSSNAKDILKAIIGNSDIEIEEEGEVIQTSIDDADIGDEDVIQLIKNFYESKITELKESSIQTKGLDDARKAMMSAIKDGVDPSIVSRFRDEYMNPLDDVDLTTEKGQEEVLRLRYKEAVEQGDMKKTALDRLIESHKSDGSLSEAAEEAFDELNDALKAKADKIKKQAEERAKETKDFYNNYKKDFKRIAKEDIGLSGGYADDLVNGVLNQDENNKTMTIFLSKVLNLLRDPETAVPLAIFVDDREKFDKLIASKVKTEALEKHKKAVRLSKKERENSGVPTRSEKEKNKDERLFTINF